MFLGYPLWSDFDEQFCIRGQLAPHFTAWGSCSFGLPTLSSLPLHILPKRSINLRLIAVFGRGMRFEPSDHIGVYAEG